MGAGGTSREILGLASKYGRAAQVPTAVNGRDTKVCPAPQRAQGHKRQGKIGLPGRRGGHPCLLPTRINHQISHMVKSGYGKKGHQGPTTASGDCGQRTLDGDRPRRGPWEGQQREKGEGLRLWKPNPEAERGGRGRGGEAGGTGGPQPGEGGTTQEGRDLAGGQEEKTDKDKGEGGISKRPSLPPPSPKAES